MRWLLGALVLVLSFGAIGAGGSFSDQGFAYAQCMADIGSRTPAAGVTVSARGCKLTTAASSYRGWWTYSDGNNTNLTIDVGDYYNFSTANSCAARASQTTQFLPLTGSKQCWNGCEVSYRQSGDDTTSVRSPSGAVCGPDYKENCPTGTFWNGYMGVCQPIQPDCPAGQVKQDGVCKPENKCPDGMVAVQGSTPGAVAQGSLYCAPSQNECPAGNVMSPGGQCLPGDGQCAQGEAKGKDGTCKRDANGDGKADEEEGEDDPNEDSASGGDDCNVPPSCNGNAIQCAQLRVQWRIDCNTRRQVNIAGGTCDAVPVCTGEGCNAMEYSQLMMQWRTVCAVEKLAKNGSGSSTGSTGDANGNGVADVLEGTGDPGSLGDGQGDVDGAKKFGLGVSTNLLDQENLFGGGSCPEPPTFELMGQTISGADFPYFCQAAAILRALILMWGAYVALKILMGWGF